jgi:hypothetical protein
MDQFGISEEMLAQHLRLAVPFWLIELASKDEEYWHKRKEVCSQTIAEKGDVILYGSKKVGAAKDAFNRLAEGCALLMLITKHPFEIFGLRFNPDGIIEDLSHV